MRRPTEEAEISELSVEEWLKLYHDVDGKRIHVESSASNLTYEEYGDGRSFTSDGHVLQTTVRLDCTYNTYSWNDISQPTPVLGCVAEHFLSICPSLLWY